MSERDKAMFQEARDVVEHAYTEAHQEAHSVCDDCGKQLFLVHGRRSGKWFWSHQGVSGCEGVRPIIFDTKQQATEAVEVFH